MSKEIKTRQIHKDIKVINKVAVGTERVREAYVRTKESAEQAQNKASPEEYMSLLSVSMRINMELENMWN